jgi:hypothetical protein
MNVIPGTLTFKTERGEIDLNQERCLTNDVIFRDEYNPHRVRPWIIGNEYGALCLVWAAHEQDAFDAACDADMLGGLAIDADHYAELCRDECLSAECHEADCPWKEDASACSCTHECDTPSGVMLLGNAGEPFDSEHAWIAEVALAPVQERYFAEARGANADNLGGV